MRILLLSDSHGNLVNMYKAVEKEQPDRIIHMGDCRKDALRLGLYFKNIPVDSVLGNCDSGRSPVELMLELEGFRIMVCHGHRYGVKGSLLTLELAAREKGADIVLFGHTHRLFYDYQADLTIINPGSIGCPPYGVPASYAVLTLDGDTQTMHLDTVFLDKD